MVPFAASLPVASLLLLNSRACLCVRLVLETTTLTLIISCGRRLIEVKDSLGLV